MFDIHRWMFSVGCSALDVHRWMFIVGCSALDVQRWMFSVGCSALDVQRWMFDVRCSMFIVGHSLMRDGFIKVEHETGDDGVSGDFGGIGGR
jgi:hypothetical protein